MLVILILFMMVIKLILITITMLILITMMMPIMIKVSMLIVITMIMPIVMMEKFTLSPEGVGLHPEQGRFISLPDSDYTRFASPFASSSSHSIGLFFLQRWLL